MTILLKIWIQIKYCFLLCFRNAIVLNGYVDGLKWQGIRHRNWGDDLNYYLLHFMTKRPVVIYQHFWLAKKLRLRNYLCIGTLLDAVDYSNTQTVVWGSGVSGQDRNFVLPAHICSVRGKKTQSFLLDRNISCPDSYGDPALLLPLYYQPKTINKKFKLGIIPHVVDQQHPFVLNIRKNHPDVLIIDLSNYRKWTDVIDQICSCEQIASSSLHGLIVSDAYGIPNCWIELTGNISGGYFKFYDYASSIDRTFVQPLTVNEETSFDTIYKEVDKWQRPHIDMKSILHACPFTLHA